MNIEAARSLIITITTAGHVDGAHSGSRVFLRQADRPHCRTEETKLSRDKKLCKVMEPLGGKCRIQTLF